MTATATAERAGSLLSRNPDLELHGEYQGNAYVEPKYLISRGDTTMQVTPVLFTVLDELSTPRSPRDLADVVSRRLGRDVDPEDIEFLANEKLRPLQLVRWMDDDEDLATAPPRSPDPLLALRFRFQLLPATVVQPLARVLSVLFHPVLAVAAVIGYLGVLVVTIDHGLTAAFRQVLLEPWHLVVLYTVLIASGVWHELGHAAACHRGGGRPGRVGAGVYLIWPSFFTDVTDSYRLSRWGRLRTDLGGIYFNIVMGVAAHGLYLATGYEPLLLVIVLQAGEILYQFIPFIRLDGYWIVTDLTGVPDLFPLTGPAIQSLHPRRPSHPAIAGLRRRARWIITAWSLITFPILALNLGLLVAIGPRLFRESLDVAREHLQVLRHPADVGIAEAILAGFGLLAALLPIVGIGLTAGLVGLRLAHYVIGRAGNHRRPRLSLWAFRLALVVAVIAAALTVTASDPSVQRVETVPLEKTAATGGGAVDLVERGGGDGATSPQSGAAASRTGAVPPRSGSSPEGIPAAHDPAPASSTVGPGEDAGNRGSATAGGVDGAAADLASGGDDADAASGGARVGAPRAGATVATDAGSGGASATPAPEPPAAPSRPTAGDADGSSPVTASAEATAGSGGPARSQEEQRVEQSDVSATATATAESTDSRASTSGATASVSVETGSSPSSSPSSPDPRQRAAAILDDLALPSG